MYKGNNYVGHALRALPREQQLMDKRVNNIYYPKIAISFTIKFLTN